MSAPPPSVTATLPNVVLMGTPDCTGGGDIIEDDIIINGGLSILSWLSPTPSDGLGHAGAVVGASDRPTIHYNITSSSITAHT